MTNIRLSEDEARLWRLRSQGLDVGINSQNSAASAQNAVINQQNGADAVAEIVRLSAGLQAQDMNTAPLQVRARSLDTKVGDVWKSLSETRHIVRTWAMRGTLHIVPAEDHKWLTGLLGPSSFSAGRGRRKELGLDESTLYKAFESFATFFTQEGPLTRQKLAEMLALEGIRVENQAIHHIVRSGGFLGYITHGPLLDGKTETFVLADEWLAGVERPELGREEALARLAGRYVRAFGPTTDRDFAVWSGLPLRDARAGWEAISGELVEVDVEGEPMAALRAALDSRFRGNDEEGVPMGSGFRRNEGSSGGNDEGVVKLLGFFDTYLLGYRG
ncbi:MAG: winged helix DNA-binding domain-containing protein, partial [Dehalococcoidia bacterium]|nr:winged helix DNA-binding domain-containing protein [Dehalococcoidia bacterium]